MRRVSNLGLICLLAAASPSTHAMVPKGELSTTPGAWIHSAQRPNDAGWPVFCSMRHLTCIHAEPSVSGSAVEALASLDRAWDSITGALDYPPPDPDPMTGTYDVYLVDRAGADTFLSMRSVASAVDRASAFSVVDGRLTGCMRDYEMARQLSRAIQMRMAPSTDEGSAHAEAGLIARVAVPCAMGLVDGVDVFQKHSERAIVQTDFSRAYSNGSTLFYWWLDDVYGRIPGALSGGLWVTTNAHTDAGADRFAAEPDGWDVLRTTLKGAINIGSSIDDVLVSFAVARALAKSDDAQLLEAKSLGNALAIEDDWSIPWPSAARKLAAPRDVYPTGASYVRVDRTGAPKGSRLRIELEWELHARMKWVVLKLGADGKERARIPIGSQDRTTSGNLTLTELDDTSQILIVGVNCGEWEPFDPDDKTWEPHRWLITLAQQ